MDTGTAILAGMGAGFAVAVPLGAIGMMLLGEGVRLGFVAAWPAALGVAAADVVYAVIAVVSGGVVAPVVVALAPWPAIASGVILLILAARGMIGIRTINGTTIESPQMGSLRRRFAVFLAVTMVNPATLVSFTAIIAGLGAVELGAWASAAFVAGVGVSSAVWQMVLVGAGGALRRRVGRRFRQVTVVVGNGLVAAFGVVILTSVFLR